jgi:signal transduction histidine kinase
VIAIRGSSAAPRDGWQVVLPGLGRPRARWKWSAPTQRDTYVGAVGLSAVALFVFAALHPTDEPWNLLAVVALFAAMLAAERMSVPLPSHAAISIASIPHTMALLLLPTWLAMLIAGASMVADQLLARASWRKLAFNTASVSLTIGLSALVADRVGLSRGQLAVNQWQQVPAFLLVACAYYGLTNGLVAIVVSLSADRAPHHIFLDNARFVLPAEFAVCGIGGLVTVIWLVCPAWTPLVLFPAVVSQVAFKYVASSKRHQIHLEFIAEASRVLAMSLDQNELAASVARLAVPALSDAAVVFLVEDDTLELAAHVEAERYGGMIGTDASLRVAEQVLVDGKTRRLSAGAQGVAVGIRFAERTLGVLVLWSGAERRGVPEDDEVAEELARRFATALENARLHAEAQRATRLRDEFLSVAAHELKTPVTSLRGYAQLMLRNGTKLDSVMLAKGLSTIEVQSNKLIELTSKLLDISRIDSGKLRLERRRVDIAELVRDCVATVQDVTSLHALRLSAPPVCEGWIDPLRFEQVLANLLNNAVKYSPDGGDIEVSLMPSGDGWIRLEVRDHGLGIPPDRRERLFDRMYQAHGDGYLSGLGLGLFISRQIVELHGGCIEAHFPAGGGTLITVSLPISR